MTGQKWATGRECATWAKLGYGQKTWWDENGATKRKVGDGATLGDEAIAGDGATAVATINRF